MAKKKYSQTEVKTQKWIKEGRGAGRERDFRWIRIGAAISNHCFVIPAI